jgi:hypothetical protein
MLFDAISASSSTDNDRAQQRQIDRSIGRALTDDEFARQMFSNPIMVLDNVGCTLSQYRSLRSIRATTVPDFARQVHQIFWPIQPVPSVLQREQMPLAASAR